VISRDDIRAILSDSRSMALPADTGDDIEFVMDSFTMVALQAALEDRYGIQLDPQFEDMHLLNSINEIHEYLGRRFPDHVAS
jgi:acyl carrier protein